jgi:hypothetical protein
MTCTILVRFLLSHAHAAPEYCRRMDEGPDENALLLASCKGRAAKVELRLPD